MNKVKESLNKINVFGFCNDNAFSEEAMSDTFN